jgi:transcriptional regulator with XRE-family HTH domain
MPEYGTEILVARTRHRLNQSDVAKAAGLYVQTIVDIENNRLGVDEPTYNRLLGAIESLASENQREQSAA